MKIWKMRFDFDKYNYLTPVKRFTVHELWDFDGHSLADTWKPREFMLAKRNKQELCDAPGFEFLILSPKAYTALEFIMGKSIEVLDVIYAGERYYGINILAVLDTIDYDKSEYETFDNSNEIMVIHKYCFRKTKELEQNHIFKIKEEEYYFVSDEFKMAVEQNQLKGFRFQLVWQSDVEEMNIKEEHKENSKDVFSYKYIVDIDSEMERELEKTIKQAEKIFHIKKNTDGKAMAWQIYEIVDRILETCTFPKEYNDIEDVAVGLGTLYGHALCLEYGWKWKLLGESKEDACINVVSEDRQYSLMPLAFIYKILSEENINIDGNNDNTVLLLFNMIGEIKNKKSEMEFYPLN